ncbi:hypothetical protein HK096_000831 [Nowakowskiella sp. JEL0078]|nr:hypothetical protein HK096_000831 [Nowakowskiella sp. JEL0078]
MSNPYLAHKEQPQRERRQQIQLVRDEQITSTQECSKPNSQKHVPLSKPHFESKSRVKDTCDSRGNGESRTAPPRKHLAIYGNYPLYYHRRFGTPPSVDPRAALIPTTVIAPNSNVLDIGCNSGLFTLTLARRCAYIEGVDIDPSLIHQARTTQRALAALSLSNTTFPVSAVSTFGLPILPSSAVNPGETFPMNATFRCSDWVTEPLPPVQQYDVVVAMSVTKWIQLAHGDTGLILFFKRVYAALKPGGRFVVEPQTSGFGKRAKMSRRLKMHLGEMKVRPEMYSEVLEGMGFGKAMIVDQFDNGIRGENDDKSGNVSGDEEECDEIDVDLDIDGKKLEEPNDKSVKKKTKFDRLVYIYTK